MIRRLPVALLLSASLLSHALAQTPPPAVGVTLAQEPLRLEEIGLTMQIPAAARVDAGHRSSPVVARIRPEDSEQDDWRIDIQAPAARAGLVAPDDFADAILERLAERFGIVRSTVPGEDRPAAEHLAETRMMLLDRVRGLHIGGREAARFYVGTPRTGDPRIQGYTVVQVEPERFIVFELNAPYHEREAARLMYETIVATARFRDAHQAVATRAKQVMRGREILRSLTTDQIDRALELADGRWERLYQPAPNGADSDATELGYRLVNAWRGRRGQLNPARPAEKFTGADLDEGLMLSMRVRVIEPGGVTIDTEGRFFATTDGASEAWNIRMARRQGDRVVGVFEETGAREGRNMKILVDGTGMPARTIRPIFAADGYLPQVHAFLLPHLLTLAAIENDYGFYAYRTADGAVKFRTDRLQEADDRPGVWRLSTTFGDGQEPQITTLAEDGRMLRTRLSEGRIWEPVELDRLVSLWRRKGLPMD